MKFQSISHKGLRRFVEHDDSKGLAPDLVPRLRRMLVILGNARSIEEIRTWPGLNAHQLVGSRKGIWSLKVNKNWRLTFSYDTENSEILDLNLEDYH